MIRKSLFLKILALAALAVFCASPASAERLSQRVARGNNVGMGSYTGWAMPWITASWTGNTIQFPKGSGNFVVNDCWTVVMGTARDLNGDGIPEDTLKDGSGGRDNMPGYCSIEGYDIITAAGAGGENMEGYMGNIQFNRIWTTKDDAELAEWPIEAREPKTSSGTPVVHGAETMFVHSGDVFNSWGGPECGFYCGWSMYFLDFAESNNMVYVHCLFENVTEYTKYNPDAGYRAIGQANPNGWTWAGMWLVHNQRQLGWMRQNMGWAYHPAKDIDVAWCKEDPTAGLSPPNPPLLAVKVLNYPKLRDQEASMLNIWTTAESDFGISGFGNLLAQGLSDPQIYAAVVKSRLPSAVVGQINPFSGREVDGWPGVGKPTDLRYNQWWWGGQSNWNHFNFYGELKDVAPRDSFSMDFVIMFPKPGHSPLVHPTYDLANVDSPYMQEALAPAEAWAEVAKTTVDGGYVTPSTPVAPSLTIVPGDREVTIAWSDVNLQTPDAYYEFLQTHPGLDPNGVYRQYDFEGFRLYRSFVGPNDSHSEVIYSSSVSGGDLSFAYVDKYNNDNPYFRMRNGLKVWYALVPYDMNYDTNTGEAFSLPDPASGKAWNRAGEAGLYNVIPRSEASNFKSATQTTAFTARGSVDASSVASATLTGNGTGLTQDPVYLAPIVDIQFQPNINEKITSDLNLYVACTRWGPNGHRANRRYFSLTDASGNVLDSPGTDLRNMYVTFGGGSSGSSAIFQGGMSSDGPSYTIQAQFNRGNLGSHWIQLDNGGWTGGTAQIATYRWDWNELSDPPYSGNGNIYTLEHTGAWEIVWKDAGGGMLSVDVHDRVQNKNLSFSPYIDDDAWGFMPVGSDPNDFASETGLEGGGNSNVFIPQSERTLMMVDKVPANGNAGEGDVVRLWVSGTIIGLTGGMPSANTKFTLISTNGDWNSDMTSFTQYPEPPYPGDRWNVKITASTLSDDDIDLSKVKVVPNPYMASSFLDLSPNQRRIDFTNLPDRCTIRIYTLGGNLVNVLNHIGANRSGWGDYTDWDRLSVNQPKVLTGYDNHGGTEPWNLRNRFGQTIASGLYFFHVTDARGKTYTGKFYVID